MKEGIATPIPSCIGVFLLSGNSIPATGRGRNPASTELRMRTIARTLGTRRCVQHTVLEVKHALNCMRAFKQIKETNSHVGNKVDNEKNAFGAWLVFLRNRLVRGRLG
jgi:hypothetical protein